ncbi:Cytochrome P450 6k1 [Frankliniella fusca]|uniref:Cytochrome P450 6k1 n=1 Tax=Frankliniella fusca TaxID=407009 RepID=A0AAE1HNP4_9NEOP|nr:Cytochrome P450 6k1 [Frankliniella fusca]
MSAVSAANCPGAKKVCYRDTPVKRKHDLTFKIFYYFSPFGGAAMLALVLAAVALALCAALLFAYLAFSMTYWRRRGVPNAPAALPWGNFADSILGRKTQFQVINDIYWRYRGERYIGTYFTATPLLHIHDPEIIRQVFIKEFQDFHGRGMHSDPERDPLSGNLFILAGQPWRNMRVKLRPTFTSGKIKYMFHTISECAAHLREHVLASIKAGGGGEYVEDVRELAARFSTDVITSVAFGVESNSMKNPDSEFRRIGQRIFEPCLENSFRALLSFFGGNIMRIFGIHNSPRDVSAFFIKVVGEIVAHRELHGVERADMMQLLIQLKNQGFVAPDGEQADKSNGHSEESITKVTEKEMAAHVFVFFLAGFETTSTTISFALFELAKNPEAQEKLLEEIDAVLKKSKGEVTYDTIMNMPYMEMVVQETMRMYPPVPFLTRQAMVRRQLPLTDLTLDKGTRLLIPVSALHYDPRYWDKPDRYDPSRFTEEAKQTRPAMVYLPFGDGPRICIGMRMGLVQVKTALVSILSRARVSMVPGTPTEAEMNPRTVIPTPMDGIRLRLSAR